MSRLQFVPIVLAIFFINACLVFTYFDSAIQSSYRAPSRGTNLELQAFFLHRDQAQKSAIEKLKPKFVPNPELKRQVEEELGLVEKKKDKQKSKKSKQVAENTEDIVEEIVEEVHEKKSKKSKKELTH